MSDPTLRREALKELYTTSKGCVRCPELAASRRTVVFGSGNADAELMFVGEAPGRNEDERGLPFVGQAGRLLEELLGEIGLSREDVFIANVLMCRPPGNRDPQPLEIDNCQGYLLEKIGLIQPKVICTLGNFATKLLRADQTGITRIHGQDEVRVIGRRAVRLLPLYHPAAALYQRSNVDALRDDIARIPGLLALPDLPQVVPDPPEAEPEPVAAPQAAAPEPEPEPAIPRPELAAAEPAREPEVAAASQLGLF